MADLNGGKGKFAGVDSSVNYEVSFTGATKVAEKVKKGGTENKPDGYVVDAIDIDWGGLKLTTIADNWSNGMQTESSTEQNAGKGDNTKGIHSTAYLLNKISSSFTQIYNQIGGSDNAGLRKRIKVVEDDIHKMAELTPGDLDAILKRIKQIEDELSDPGATTAVLSILDTLEGFDKNKKGDVKEYIDNRDNTILGSTADAETAYTVYGVRKYVDTTAKNTLLGASGDAWPTKQTLFGVAKYADTTVKNSLIGQDGDQIIDTHWGVRFLSYNHTDVTKDILIGASTDAATANTIWGAKNYAVEKDGKLEKKLIGASTDASTADTIWGAKNYAKEKAEASYINAVNNANDHTDTQFNILSDKAFHVQRIVEGDEGILEFVNVSSVLGVSNTLE